MNCVYLGFIFLLYHKFANIYDISAIKIRLPQCGENYGDKIDIITSFAVIIS